MMNQARQCTTGNTQGLLTIPKQLSSVNKKVARISQPYELWGILIFLLRQ